MAEEKGNLESLLSSATKREREYDWLGATDLYEHALKLMPCEEFTRISDSFERKAYCLYRFALQSENVNEFRERIIKAAECYDRAKAAFSEKDSSEGRAKASRCDGMISLMMMLRSVNPGERRLHSEKSWEETKTALDGFEAAGDSLEFCKTFNDLFIGPCVTSSMAPDFSSRMRLQEEENRYSEKAAELSNELADSAMIARTLVLASGFQLMTGPFATNESEKDARHNKALDLLRKAGDISEATVLENIPLLGIVRVMLTEYGVNREAKWELSTLRESLEIVNKTKDKLMIGHALSYLTFYANWYIDAANDKEETDSLVELTRKYAAAAKAEFEKIGFQCAYGGDIWVMSYETPCDWAASYYENDLALKRQFAERALHHLPEFAHDALRSGYTQHIANSALLEGGILYQMSKSETNRESKRAMLERATLAYRKGLEIWEKWDSGNKYNVGNHHVMMAMIQAELGELASSRESRIEALREATVLLEKGAAEFMEGMRSRSLSDVGTLGVLSTYQYELAKRYCSLFEQVRDTRLLTRAIETYEMSADSGRQAGLPARSAECLWGAARTYDEMGDHLMASARFVNASHGYREAADKTPRLRALFEDQILYMRAWSEIEKAKFHHSRQDPASSRENYKKAAELHASSERWNFLSANYLAWAEIENAEDLSQNDRSADSIESFHRAEGLLEDSEKAMRSRADILDSPEERQLVYRLICAVGQRRAFCQARIALEEARLLDMAGNLDSASERYGLVSEQFTKIEQDLDSEKDKKETQLIITLSKAWKAMARAEAESSPDLYEEAARLFLEAKDLSPGEKAKALAMGHSRMCLALAAGSRYADAGDPALHDSAVQDLESAAKFYLKANQPTAVEYVKGSRLLFDGYDYMNRASKERDEQKKTRLYATAEKVLLASVSAFEKANQHGRKEQVLKILAKVKEDRELALSLVDVFIAPDMVQTTMAFTSPGATLETAAGLDRFEHAEIRATLIAKPKDLHVGQELSLEIELVNAGRRPAQLTKIEETVPKGFIVLQEPDRCRMEDRHVNMRGWILNALGSLDIKLLLKPTAKGRFRFNPRILYLDDSGTYRSCEPTPIEIVVKEMGITGWIKGT